LPFTNNRGEGFENKIVALIAVQLKQPLEYVWWAQRRGFVRNALAAGLCDVIPGIATSVEGLLPTDPYYRSSYVFVGRTPHPPWSFDDPALRRMRLGVQIIGDDYANTPPAHELARRGIVDVKGYRVTGDYLVSNGPARIVGAVADGEIDLAVAWGPMAGYFAVRQTVPLYLSPIADRRDLPESPLDYDIGMGVRKGDFKLKAELDRRLKQNRVEIAGILREFRVPVSAPIGPGRGKD